MPRECYRFDAARSRFRIRITTSGVLALLGQTPVVVVSQFAAELEFAAESHEGGFRLTVPTPAITVNGSIRPSDRQDIEQQLRAEVFETAAFSEIHFVCNQLEVETLGGGEYTVHFPGELTLHGVTRPERVTARLTLQNHDVRLVGEHTLSQAAYHIRRVTALAGAVSVNDDVTLSFDLVGQRQSP